MTKSTLSRCTGLLCTLALLLTLSLAILPAIAMPASAGEVVAYETETLLTVSVKFSSTNSSGLSSAWFSTSSYADGNEVLRNNCNGIVFNGTVYPVTWFLLSGSTTKWECGFPNLSDSVGMENYPFSLYLMSSNGWCYIDPEVTPMGTYTIEFVSLTIVEAPDIPELECNFGGEVTYTRGASATPLSVTVTNAVNGTLSYQWYYIDSENVDVAVPISGATGTTYTPDTSRVGSRYYYCIVTNTLGELSESMCSDYAYITVERPALGDGYEIYDYKDYVTGAVVDGSNKAYTVTFPMSGIYTEVYGGFDSEYSLLDYFEGTNFLVDIPTDALAADNYDLRFAYYPLGTGSQYNVLKLSNIPYGIAASYVFWMDYQADSSHGDPVLTFLWYDSEMQLIGSTDYALTWDYDIELGYTTYSLDFDFNYPSGASYCAYSISVPAFSSEENMDFSARIVTADLVLTLSMMEDISGSVGEVGDKVDQVGDKIDDTNDKLDDILTGGEAGEELIQGSDKLDQSGEQLGGVVDDLHGAQDALPDLPDDIEDVLVNNTALVADSDVNGLMPWSDPDYGEFWNLLFTPTVAAVSVALLLYFVFGKARSTA